MGGLFSGGVVSVFAGSTVSGFPISGGTEYVFGTTTKTTIFAGLEVVESGGITSGTIVSGGTEIVSGGGISLDTLVLGHGTELVESGGTTANLALLGKGRVGGRAILSGLTSVGSGAILETLPGGSAIVDGMLSNAGTLYADGGHSLVDILSGAIVTGGGVTEVGNGIVDLETASDAENVIFHAGGTGGFEIGALGGAYAGTVFGFAQNVHQFIDFTAISAAGATFSYSSTSSSSGVLTVTNGGISASINLSGNYTSASFHISAGPQGTVELTEAASGISPISPISPISRPDVFLFTKNIVLDDIFAGKIALLGNYIAAGFAAGGPDATVAAGAQQTEQQTLLTHPART